VTKILVVTAIPPFLHYIDKRQYFLVYPIFARQIYTYLRLDADTIKELMSYPKCRSVTVINNPARPGSNHREVNYINYNNNNNNNNNKNNNNNNNNNDDDDDLKRTLRYKIIKED